MAAEVDEMDNRVDCKGSYSAWLKKVKSDSARAKWLVGTTKRYFTIDFDAKIFFYSHSEGRKKVSQPIKFVEMMGAERLPPSKKKGCGFVLRTTDRAYELYTSTNPDAARWVHALNAARDMANTNATEVANLQPVAQPVAMVEPVAAVDVPLNESNRTDDSHELADTTSEGNAYSPPNEKTAFLGPSGVEGEEEHQVADVQTQRPLRPKVLAPLFSIPNTSIVEGNVDKAHNANLEIDKEVQSTPREQKVSPSKEPPREQRSSSPSATFPSPHKVLRSDGSPQPACLDASQTVESIAEDYHSDLVTPEQAIVESELSSLVAALASPSPDVVDSRNDLNISNAEVAQQKVEADPAEVKQFVLETSMEEIFSSSKRKAANNTRLKARKTEIETNACEQRVEPDAIQNPTESSVMPEKKSQALVAQAAEEKQLSAQEHSPNSELDDIPSPLALKEGVCEVVSKVPPCPKSLKELPFAASALRESRALAPIASSSTLHKQSPAEDAAVDNELDISQASDACEQKQESFNKTGNTLQSAMSGTLPKKNSSVRFSEEAAEIVEVEKIDSSCWQHDAIDDEEAILAAVEDDDASDWDSEEEAAVTLFSKGRDKSLDCVDGLLCPSKADHSLGRENVLTDGVEDWDTDEEEPVTLNADPVEPSGWDSDDDLMDTSLRGSANRDSCEEGRIETGAFEEVKPAVSATSTTGIDEVDELVGMVLAAEAPVSLTPPFRGSEKYGFVPGLHCTACDFQVMRIENYKWNSSANYMFFRNNYPNAMRLRKGLSPQVDLAAFCCQCSWKSVDADAPIAVVSEGLRWNFISA